MKSISLFLIVLFLGCSGDKEEALLALEESTNDIDLPFDQNDIDNAESEFLDEKEDQELINETVEEDKDEPDSPEKKKEDKEVSSFYTDETKHIFKFSLLKGKCLDKGEEGLNSDFWGECGDLSAYPFDGENLDSHNLMGASLRGSILRDVYFSPYNFVYQEIKFDGETVFPESFTEPYLVFKKENLKIFKELRGKVKEQKRGYASLKKDFKVKRKAYRKDRSEENLEALKKAKENLDEEKVKIREINSKKKRHKKNYKVLRKMEKEQKS